MIKAFSELKQRLASARHRHLIVLCGEYDWRVQTLAELAQDGGVWLGESSPIAAFVSRETSVLRQHLGQEIQQAAVCAEQGIDAEALALVSGMIRAGGVLWLLIPPLDTWLNLPNPANQRFMSYPLDYHQAWSGFNHHLLRHLEQDALWLHQYHTPQWQYQAPPMNAYEALTPDQQHGLSAIMALAQTASPRPLVMSAKRGRGKSTLLGEAAVSLMQQGKHRIVISAMRIEQCENLFNRIQLHQTEIGSSAQKSVSFIAPDALLAKPISADIVLIDEAAHWPVAMLKTLLRLYPRVVLATTLEGYEGSAQGFNLTLKPHLDQYYTGWKTISLTQPIRWAAFDPLEKMMDALLGCQVDIVKRDETPLSPLSYSEERFGTLTNEQQWQVWALLRTAHYQTTPADLQQWLCAPNLRFTLAWEGEQIVGVLLSVNEGELPNLGVARRVKGHLVPQLLRLHTGHNELITYTWQRIMRVAVHPNRRRRGIGQALIRYWSQQQSTDWLSVSYGLTAELLPFWRKLGFFSVHLGAKRDKASASYNLVMVKTERQSAVFDALRQRYGESLPHQLMETAEDLSANLALMLLAERAQHPTPEYESAAMAYAQSQRPYEAVSAALWHWTGAHAQAIAQLQASTQTLWLNKVLRKHSWQRISETQGIAGRKAIEQQLKQTIVAIKDSELNTLGVVDNSR